MPLMTGCNGAARYNDAKFHVGTKLFSDPWITAEDGKTISFLLRCLVFGQMAGRFLSLMSNTSLHAQCFTFDTITNETTMSLHYMRTRQESKL